MLRSATWHDMTWIPGSSTPFFSHSVLQQLHSLFTKCNPMLPLPISTTSRFLNVFYKAALLTQYVTNPVSLISFFPVLLYVGCSFPSSLCTILLHFSHNRSGWSSPFFSSTTIQDVLQNQLDGNFRSSKSYLKICRWKLLRSYMYIGVYSIYVCVCEYVYDIHIYIYTYTHIHTYT